MAALTGILTSDPNIHVTQLTTAFNHIHICINKIQPFQCQVIFVSCFPLSSASSFLLFLERIFCPVSALISLLTLGRVCYAGYWSEGELGYHLML